MDLLKFHPISFGFHPTSYVTLFEPGRNAFSVLKTDYFKKACAEQAIEFTGPIPRHPLAAHYSKEGKTYQLLAS